jgi:hypothetical protein
MKLKRDEYKMLVFPEEVPSDANELLMLMDDAAAYAQKGQGVSSSMFDHGMRIFNQLNAHYQITVARELAKAHEGLRTATLGLKVATWCLASITILLAAIEVWKVLTH